MRSPRKWRVGRASAVPRLWMGLVLVLPVSPASAQPTELCAAAEDFAVRERGMVALVDPDTLNDWRTGQRLVGCRVTAAGVTGIGLRAEAERFYEVLRAAGWTRTPDPRDSPGEASLRFRKGAVDCLFNVYGGVLLFTESEFAVTDAVIPSPGGERYHLLALCVPALDAAPREEAMPKGGGPGVEGSAGIGGGPVPERHEPPAARTNPHHRGLASLARVRIREVRCAPFDEPDPDLFLRPTRPVVQIAPGRGHFGCGQ